MKEEQVTKNILKWLINNGWKIVCYDFPQSGTGRFLHPNGSSSKNENSINPDIVAVKEPICLFLENKDHFYFPDFQKVNNLIVRNDYSNSISELLKEYSVKKIYYGIGIPSSCYSERAQESSNLVDFILGVESDGEITELYTTICI